MLHINCRIATGHVVRDGVQAYDIVELIKVYMLVCMQRGKLYTPKILSWSARYLGFGTQLVGWLNLLKKEVAIDWNTVKTKLPVRQGPPPGILAQLRKQAARKAGKGKYRSKVSKQ